MPREIPNIANIPAVVQRGQAIDDAPLAAGAHDLPEQYDDWNGGIQDVGPYMEGLFERPHHNGQRALVAMFKALTAKRSPLAILRKPGASYHAAMSSELDLDVITTLLTAALHGAPIPPGLIASLGPKLSLELAGDVSTGDDTALHSSLTITITGGLDASVIARLGLNVSASVSVSASLSGIYDSLEHLVAVYLRGLTKLLMRAFGYALYRTAKRRLGGRPKHRLSDYANIRELAKRRRTNVKSVGAALGVDADAIMGLFGAGVDVSITGTRASRKRDLTDHVSTGSKKHESKRGFVAEGSVHLKAGPFSGDVTLSIVERDTNPDNDGVYIIATLSGAASAGLSLVQAAPEALSDLTFSMGDGMDLLSGNLSGVIEKMNLPIGGANLGVHVGTDVVLVWYKAGSWRDIVTKRKSPFHLLYARTVGKAGADLGASGVPVYAGVSLGLGIGGEASRVTKETLGHSSIAYVQALYLGMQSQTRQPWRAEGEEHTDDWRRWSARHEQDLRRMMASRHCYDELMELAHSNGQAGVSIFTRTLQPAFYGQDFDRWLAGVERLFELEAQRRKGAGGVSAGWNKSASAADLFKGAARKVRNLLN